MNCSRLLECFFFLLLKSGDELPHRRDFHSATNLNNRMYIFGGRSEDITPEHSHGIFYDNRLHVFDPQENFWSLVSVKGDAPRGRRSHSACVLTNETPRSLIF